MFVSVAVIAQNVILIIWRRRASEAGIALPHPLRWVCYCGYFHNTTSGLLSKFFVRIP